MRKKNILGHGMTFLMKVYTSPIVEKYNLRKPIESLVYKNVKRSFKTINTVSAKASKKKKANRKEHTKNKLVFNLSLSEEQRMICDEIQRFADNVMRPYAYEADKNRTLPDDFFERSLELGLSYFAVPESLGGSSNAIEPITSCLISEKLAWGDMSMAYALGAPLAFANVIRHWGTEEQQAHYLSLFVKEHPPKAVVALQEEGISFDSYKLATKAKSNSKGFTLNGEKILLPLGGKEGGTEYYCVAAMYKDKPRLFIVPADSKGLTWENQNAMGLRAAQTGKLILNNVKLKKSALVGTDASFDYKQFIDYGRLNIAALAIGCCQAVLDYVVPYVNEREAFGEPISHRQGVAFIVADMAIEIEGMRLLLWRAASRAQQGLDFHKQASLAHALCCEKAMQIGTNGVQLLGGHGFTKEHPVERWYRDLRAIVILSGGHS